MLASRIESDGRGSTMGRSPVLSRIRLWRRGLAGSFRETSFVVLLSEKLLLSKQLLAVVLSEKLNWF